MYGEIKRIRAIEKRKRRAKRKREVEVLGDKVLPHVLSREFLSLAHFIARAGDDEI